MSDAESTACSSNAVLPTPASPLSRRIPLRPSRASRAISASCGERSSRVSTLRFRTRSPGRQQLSLGSPGERLGAHAREHLERRAQLPAGVEAAALTAQPLAVEEMSAREIDAYACPSSPFDRLPVETVCGSAAAEQSARAGFDPQGPIGATGAGRLGEALKRMFREV